VFPKLMATAFSGYYLALFLILWCLILRGMALEVGGHINDRMWQGFWDFVFVVSSALLALLFGVAGGNLARGVPLDGTGSFAMAFFTNFEVRGHVGLLDWYTVSIGVLAMVLLGAHGASYLTLRTEGPVHDRSRVYARWLWAAFVPLLVLVSIESWIVRPELPAQAFGNPFAWIGFLVVAAAAVAILTGLRRDREMCAFLGSSFLVGGLLATGAAAIYPVVLHSTLAPGDSLTVQAVASSHGSLVMALLWWPIAFVLAASYFIFLSRKYAGKVSVRRDNQGYY
jgi:cytochrome d ubiquinol oxidase subunit II